MSLLFTVDGHIYRAVPSSQRGVDRQRPYADPYSEAYTEEGDGALSPWSVEQDVRKMLYNGEDASLHTVSMQVRNVHTVYTGH